MTRRILPGATGCDGFSFLYRLRSVLYPALHGPFMARLRMRANLHWVDVATRNGWWRKESTASARKRRGWVGRAT
jgi:hypothetical protein